MASSPISFLIQQQQPVRPPSTPVQVKREKSSATLEQKTESNININSNTEIEEIHENYQ